MSRIASLAADTSIIQQMLRTQKNLQDLMTQVNSGKESQDYAGISPDSQRLVNLENQTSLLGQYVKNNDIEQTRLNIASSTLGDIQSEINNFQQLLSSFNQQGSYTEQDVNSIQAAAFRSLKNIETLLNTEVDGRYLFSGGAGTTQPVDFGVSSLSDFQAVYDGNNVTVPTTRDGDLKTFSYSTDQGNTNAQFIDGSQFLQFRRDGDGDSTTSGSSTIRASSAVFANTPVGTTIHITNTTSNNGTYTVKSVSSDGTTATVQTTMLTNETDLKLLADENPGGAVSFKLPSGSTVTSGAGNITFNRLNGTITDAGGGLFSSVSAGDLITISGTNNNNGTVKVQSVDGTNSVITVAFNQTSIASADGTVSLNNTDTGNLTFSRSGDSITAAVSNAFSGLSVGDIFTVSGTAQNDGTYTVKSNDGTTIKIEANKLTDEGLSRDSSNDTDLNFSGTTIQAYKTGTTTVQPSVFSNLTAGDQITVTGSASNNGTYTVATVSGDGSSITVGSALTAETLVQNASATVKTVRVTDEVDLNQLTNETPAGAVAFQLPDGSTVTSGAGNITFASGAATITDSAGGLFSNVSAGDIINISGTTSNNGRVKVQSVGGSNSVLTIVPLSTSITDNTLSTTVNNTATGTLTFSRSGDSITAGNAGSLAGFNVGDSITVAGTDLNNGSYTIASNNGTTIGIVPNDLIGDRPSTNTFFDYPSDTDVKFTASSKKIEIDKSGLSTAVPNVFTNLQVGDQIDVRGSSSNNGTYTIASIASDGSYVTVSESLTDETLVSDATISGNGNGFSYTSGTKLDFVDNGTGSNTIQAQDSGGTAVSNVFSTLKAGDTFTVSGTDANHDGTYTVKSVSSNGSQITIDEAFPNAGGNLTDDNGAQIQAFAAGGTVSADSYYKGTDQSTTHRVDKDRSFQFDITAASPGFEKAIRAMQIIMQGSFGTQGGLDQNKDRVRNALYLVNSSLNKTVNGNPPYGTEKTGSVEQMHEDVGFNQYLIKQVNQRHQDFIGFLQQGSSKIEDADPLASITKLLDEQRALQASYQAFAKIRQLSLTNFL